MFGLMTSCSNADDPVIQPEEKDTFLIAIDEKHFPDAAFCAYLKENCEEWAADGVLTEEEANDVKTLYVTKHEIQGIKSVKGIEWFKNLDMLEVSGQELAEIPTPMSGMSSQWNRLLQPMPKAGFSWMFQETMNSPIGSRHRDRSVPTVL